MIQVYKGVSGGGCVCVRGEGVYVREGEGVCVREGEVNITDLDLRPSCLLIVQEMVIQCVNRLHQLLTMFSPSS